MVFEWNNVAMIVSMTETNSQDRVLSENGKNFNQDDVLTEMDVDEEFNTQYSEKDKDSVEKSSNAFLALPYEIRRIIYQNLFCDDKMINSIRSVGYLMKYRANDKGHDLHPKIMGTCSQVHSECQDILYGENKFQVHS